MQDVHPLIAVDELASVLASVVVLDVRWRLGGPPGEAEYASGHIPGARYVDLEADLAAPVAPDGVGGRHPLPEPEVFAAAMRRVGVSAGSTVVAYDDAAGTSAARLWWLLRHHGHDDVRVLDGGWAAWRDAGLPVQTGTATVVPGDFAAVDGRLPVLDASGAAALAESGVLLDARAAERYRAEIEPIDPVAGHIPGAVSAPTTANVDAAGRFLPAERLRQRFAALGVRAGEPVGSYCGSGVTAAHELLALEVAGLGGGALYAGSWSDWVSDPMRPVATGD